ncbi:MAG: cobalamin biosynthesis protein, partial [bacterium]|nr:cobalamin biosynthesis protein [bacterium]
MLYHIIAFSLGCLLDIIIGDPHWMPHPIRWIGNLIGRLEKRLNKNGLDARSLKLRGLCLVIIVVFVPSIICFSLMALLYGLNVYAGIGAEAIVTCYMLAGR